jgi:hypothetical protein
MKTAIEIFCIPLLFGSGIVLGYYFGLVREHRLYMCNLEKLERKLLDMRKADSLGVTTWESQSKN